MKTSVIFLLMFLALPLTCWVLNATLLRRRIHWLLLFPLACISGYLVLLVAVQFANVEADQELNQYDLNGDGIFSAEETTPVQQKAMEEWASDTGRVMAPILGVPMTLIWTTLNFIVIAIADWLICCIWRLVHRKPVEESIEGAIDEGNLETVPISRPQLDNPYSPAFLSRPVANNRYVEE